MSSKGILSLSSIQSSETKHKEVDQSLTETDVSSVETESDHNAKIWSEKEMKQVKVLWKLSSEEMKQLQDLQKRLSDVDHWKNSPLNVVRFLRARPGDVVAAEKMFRDMVQWRQENNVDNFLKNYKPPQEMVNYFPTAILQGCDKDGDPILIDRPGVTDVTEMYKRYGKDEMINRAIWIREMITNGDWTKNYEKEKGKPISKITIVTDVYGIGRSHMNRDLLSVFKEVASIEEKNYCETAKRIIIIRAPAIFRVIWGIIKNFIDPGIKEKIEFASSSNYLKILEQHMDIAVLPYCINPKSGKGEAVQGMPQKFDGGELPRL